MYFGTLHFTLKPLYEPSDQRSITHLLSRKLKYRASQARQGKQTKAPQPEIAVRVPLLFAPFPRQKEKATGAQCLPRSREGFLLTAKDFKQSAKRDGRNLIK